MNILIALVIFVIGLLVAKKSPVMAIYLLVLAVPTYLVKINLGALPTTMLELLIYGSMVGWLIDYPKLRLNLFWQTLRPIIWPLGLVLVGLAIGTLVSSDTKTALGIIKGWFVDPILVYGLAVAVLTSKHLRGLVSVLLVSSLPISITALWQVVTGDFVTIDHRASAWFVSANYLSLYLVPILLISTGLFWDKLTKWQNWLVGIIIGIGLLAVFFSFSYSGWLGLVAGSVVIGIWRLRQYWQFWVGGLGAVGFAIASQLRTDRVIQMLDFKTQSSASVRLQIWATDWLMTREHWMTGIGLGQYSVQYPTTITRLFASPLEPNMLHAHNLYFQFIINTGVVGLVGFIGLVVKFFITIRQANTVWSAGLVAGMVAILAHGLVDTPYWKNDLALLFWLNLAMAVIASRSNKLTPHQS